MKIFNLLFACCLLSCATTQSQNYQPQKQIVLARSVTWFSDVDQASMLASKQNKPLLIYFHQSSSIQCSKMSKTINDSRIVDLLNDKFVALQADVELSALAKTIDIKYVPAIVIVVPTPEGGRLASVMVGYHDVNSFFEFLNSSLE